MAVLKYEDQSADALRLNLVRGAVDKKSLTVLCSGNIDVPYGTVEVGIIGASHYFEFTAPCGYVLFTEVFACTEVSSEKREFYGDINDASYIRKRFGDTKYSFRVKKRSWKESGSEFERLCDAVSNSTSQSQLGLIYSFPSTENAEFVPLTLVYAQADPDRKFVEVETIHAYPNEGTLVFTKTQLQKQ